MLMCHTVHLGLANTRVSSALIEVNVYKLTKYRIAVKNREHELFTCISLRAFNHFLDGKSPASN